MDRNYNSKPQDELNILKKQYDVLIEEHQKVLAETSGKDRLIELLSKSSAELINFSPNNASYLKILETITEISGAKYGSFNIFDENGFDFTTVAISGLKKNLQKGLSILGIEMVGAQWKHDPQRFNRTANKTITLFNNLHDLAGNAIPSAAISIVEKMFGLGKAAIVNISKDGLLIGDFTLVFETGTSFQYADLVTIYAQQVGMALEANRTNSALKMSNARHSSLITNITDVISILDQSGIIFYISPNVLKLFGWNTDEIINREFRSILHPDDSIRYQNDLNSSINVISKTLTTEYRIKCGDGSFKPIQISMCNQCADPDIGGVLLNFHDISVRKQAEEELVMAKESYVDIFNSVSEAIYVQDERGCFIDMNKGAEILNRCNRSFLIGKTPADLVADQSNIEKGKELTARVLKTGLSQRFEIQAKRSDDEIYPKEVIINRGKYFGKTVLITTARDMSEQHKAEETLRNSYARNKALLDCLPDVIMVFDSSGLVLDCHIPLQEKIWEPADHYIGKSIFDCFQAETATFAYNIIQTVSQSTQITDFSYECSTSLGMQYFEARAVPSGNKQVLAFIRNVTARKLSDKELSEKDHLLKSIAENSPNIIYIFDVEQKRNIYINRSLSKVLGYTDSEFSDQDAGFFETLMHPEDMQQFEKFYEQVKDCPDDFIFNFEYRIKHKNGTWRWLKGSEKVFAIENGTLKSLIGTVQDVTAEKHADEIIRQNEQKYRLIAENTSDGILSINAANQIVYVSPSYKRQLGYSEEETLTHSSDFIYKTIHPDDRDRVFKIIFDAIALHQEDLEYKYRVKHKDGHYIWREDHAHFSYDNYGNYKGANVVCSDITRNVEAEQLLRESEEKFRLIAENTSDTITLLDMNLKTTYVSPGIFKLRGFTPEEAIQHSLEQILTPDSLRLVNELFTEKIQSVLADNVDTSDFTPLELEQYHKNGSTVWVELTYSLLRNQQNLTTGFVAITRDISQRKLTEKELIQAREKAEESDRLKSAFLANMSHEIRTPMNGILGFAELLREPGLTGEQQQEYLKIIKKSGDRMLNIINDIVDISKIESGMMNLTLSTVNVNDLIEYIFTFFKPETDRKNLQFNHSALLPAQQVTIETDKEKLYAILINLVKNAIKYTNVGTIEFGYRIEYRSEVRVMLFYVSDTGSGIAKERQSAIFERFIQADIHDHKAQQGAGLGLSITKAYVSMLSGEIWVESELNRGSIFSFTLPYKPAVQSSTSDKDVLVNDMPLALVKKLKILIAEDEETSEMLMSILLKSIAASFILVQTGSDAVEAMQQNPDVDLVLMDVKMPLMDGYEATRRIRTFNAGVVIVAQTAYALSGEYEKAKAAGCTDFISKPVNKDKLLGIINKYF